MSNSINRPWRDLRESHKSAAGRTTGHRYLCEVKAAVFSYLGRQMAPPEGEELRKTTQEAPENLKRRTGEGECRELRR